MDTRGFMALESGVFLAVMGFILLFAVLMIICNWILYSKAGQPGWACIIPVYSIIVLLKIVGRPVSWIFWFLQVIFFEFLFVGAPNIITGFLFLLSAVAILVFAIIITNGLSKSFGKDAGFTVGLILLPFVFYPILAFGKDKYIGPGGNAPSDEVVL